MIVSSICPLCPEIRDGLEVPAFTHAFLVIRTYLGAHQGGLYLTLSHHSSQYRKMFRFLAVCQELATKTKDRFLTQVAVNYRSQLLCLARSKRPVSQAMAAFCFRINAGIVVISHHAQLNSQTLLCAEVLGVVGDLDLLSGEQKILSIPTLNTMLNIILSSG